MRPSHSNRMDLAGYHEQVKRDLARFMLPSSHAAALEHAATIRAGYAMNQDTEEVARTIAKIEGSPLADGGRAKRYTAIWDGQPRGTMTLAEAKKIATGTGHSVTLNEVGRTPSGGATVGWVNPDGTHRLGRSKRKRSGR